MSSFVPPTLHWKGLIYLDLVTSDPVVVIEEARPVWLGDGYCRRVLVESVRSEHQYNRPPKDLSFESMNEMKVLAWMS